MKLLHPFRICLCSLGLAPTRSCSHQISQDHEDMMSAFTSNVLPCKKWWPFNVRTCKLNMKCPTYWNIRKAPLETDELCMILLLRFSVASLNFVAFLVVMDGSKVVLEGLVEWDKRWITLAHCEHCHSNKKTIQIESERLKQKSANHVAVHPMM